VLTVRGTRAAQEVWEDYVRPARWSSWAPQILGVDAPAGIVAPGLRGVVHGPLGLRVRFVVTTVDPPGRRWRWIASVAGLDVGMEHAVVAVPGGCLTTLTIEAPATVRVLYAPVAAAALRRLVRG